MTIAVLGGGITGLTAAWRLVSAGHEVRLFEQSSRVGGSIVTTDADGWLSEGGPNTVQDDGTELAEMVDALGLGSERIEASPEAKHRFVFRHGVPIAVPSSPAALLSNRLLSPAGRIRAVAELFLGRRTAEADLSVAEFGRRHFGAEATDYAVRPMVSGVFAGDADKLSTRRAFPRLWRFDQEHGSILRAGGEARRAARAAGKPYPPKLISFRGGMQVLTDALARKLPAGTAELGAEVERLEPGSGWTVAWRLGGASRAERFDRVLVALPPRALSRLVVGRGGERPLASLGSISCPPLASLFLGFQRSHVAHRLDGFGVLVPPREKQTFLGVLFSTTLFPGRAPAGHVALTVLAGGALQPAMAIADKEALWKAIQPDLSRMLGVSGEPACFRLTHWSNAIPQYDLGYDTHLDTLAACEKRHPGIHFGGNVRDGISVPDCIRSGMRLAGEV